MVDSKTFEESQITGQANQAVDNSLSSVEITHTTKGDTWKVKVYHEDPYKAEAAAVSIEQEMRERYGNKT